MDYITNLSLHHQGVDHSQHNGTNNARTPPYLKYYEHVSSPWIPRLYHIQGIITTLKFNKKAEGIEPLCILWGTHRSLLQCQCYCQFWKSFNPVYYSDLTSFTGLTNWQMDKTNCLTPLHMCVQGNNNLAFCGACTKISIQVKVNKNSVTATLFWLILAN